MTNVDILKHVLEVLTAVGFFAFVGRAIKKWRSMRNAREQQVIDDRRKFDRLIEDVGLLNMKVTKIDTKIKVLEDLQRNRMNAQGLAFFESDSDGKAVYVSPSMQVMVGQPEQRLRDFGWIECLIDEDRQRIWKAWNFSIKHLTVFDEIFSFRSAGGVVKVHGMAFHSRDEYDKCTGSFGQLKLYDDENIH